MNFQVWSSISKFYLGSMCTAVLIGWDPAIPPPPHIWAHLWGRYWSAKIDICLWPPASTPAEKTSNSSKHDCLRFFLFWILSWPSWIRIQIHRPSWIRYGSNPEQYHWSPQLWGGNCICISHYSEAFYVKFFALCRMIRLMDWCWWTLRGCGQPPGPHRAGRPSSGSTCRHTGHVMPTATTSDWGSGSGSAACFGSSRIWIH